MTAVGEQVAAKDYTKEPVRKKRRLATVFDAVTGKVGQNGFLSKEEYQAQSPKPSKPEEVLLRRLDAPQDIPFDYYAAEEKLAATGPRLPDTELLKDLHAYVADFYEVISGADFDFRSFDETSLIAMGILLEEACKEVLGENGDMVLAEPQSVDGGLPENKWTRYQIIGKVVPVSVQEYQSASDEEEEAEMVTEPSRKRQRRQYLHADN